LFVAHGFDRATNNMSETGMVRCEACSLLQIPDSRKLKTYRL
jgi:hypothetical protein